MNNDEYDVTYNYSKIINNIESTINSNLSIRQKIFVNKFVEIPILDKYKNLFVNYNILPLPIYTINNKNINISNNIHNNITGLLFFFNTKKKKLKFINKNPPYLKLENNQKLYVKTSIKISFLKLLIICTIIRIFVNPQYLKSNNYYFNFINFNLYLNKHNTLSISKFNIFTTDFEINCNKYINLIMSKIINIIKISLVYPKTKLLNNLVLAPLYKSYELLLLNEQVLNGYPYDYPTKKELSKIDNLIKQFIYESDRVLVTYKYIDFEEDKIINKILMEIKKINNKMLLNIWLDCFCKNDSLSKYAEIYFINSDLKYFINFNHIFSFNLIYINKLKIIPRKIYYIKKLLATRDDKVKDIDLTYNSYSAFRYSCLTLNFEIAEWLYNTGKIDINVNNDICFLSVLKQGDLEFAKWLYNIGNINIYTNKSEGFILACMKNDTKIYNWLWEISEDKQKFFSDWDSCWSDNKDWLYNMYKYYNILVRNKKLI